MQMHLNYVAFENFMGRSFAKVLGAEVGKKKKNKVVLHEMLNQAGDSGAEQPSDLFFLTS